MGFGHTGEARLVSRWGGHEEGLGRSHHQAERDLARERDRAHAVLQGLGIADGPGAVELGAVLRDEPDRAGVGAERRQPGVKHHPRRVLRCAHRHEGRRDRLQGGQPGRAPPSPVA